MIARAALAAGAVLAGAPAAAQEDWARALAERAPALQQAGRYDEAAAEIEAGRARCGAAAAGAKCGALLDYAAAYLAEREAAKKGRDSAALRRSAVAAYQRVLAHEPGHVPTARALARLHRLTGAPADAVAVLRDAVARAPGNAGLGLDLGDSHVAAREPREAIAAYERASEAPGGSAALAKIADAYGLLPPAAQAELLERGRAWRAQDPSAARAAFEAVLARTVAEGSDVAGAALVDWVDLLGAQRALTAAAVDALGLPADFAPARDLRAYMAQPWERPSGWWMQDERGMDALARASLALGSAMARADRPESAEKCWQVAAHLYGAPSVARVEVQTALAGLYARHPALDPSGSRAEALIQELFEGKGLAYRRADLAAIQQYHTVLGVFLFERGVFGTATTPRSALFQLEHALNMAQRREREGTPYQPLAELRMRLAESYEKAGSGGLAARAYAMAAQAFLDEDQAGRAREALRHAERLGGPAPPEMARLLTLRERGVASRGDAGLRLFDEPWPGALPSAFRERQQFKVLADGAAATGSVALAARALAASREQPLVLVGAADQLRLEAAYGLVASRFGIDAPVVRTAWPARNDGALRKFYATTTPAPEYVYVPSDALLGARIVDAAGEPPAGATLSLAEGVLVATAGDAAARAYVARASRVPGVRDRREP